LVAPLIPLSIGHSNFGSQTLTESLAETDCESDVRVIVCSTLLVDWYSPHLDQTFISFVAYLPSPPQGVVYNMVRYYKPSLCNRCVFVSFYLIMR